MADGSKGDPFRKDPNDKVDYKWDFASLLESGETINTSNVTVASGLTEVSTQDTTTTVTVVVSGGTAGTTYKLTAQITTTGGSVVRTFERDIWILVTEL